MEAAPINLRERFGRRYKVAYEPSHRSEYGPGARTEDSWLMIVPCKYGHVFPFGGTTLAASVDGHPGIAARLRRLPCCRVWQDGDDGELTALFDVADFPVVAKIMRPRRRRRLNLTPEQRETIGRRLHGGRPNRDEAVADYAGTREPILQKHSTARGCVPEVPADQYVTPAQLPLFGH